MRLHIDYGDIIYDQPNNDSFCDMIEGAQYNAALAITGAIKGTSNLMLYKNNTTSHCYYCYYYYYHEYVIGHSSFLIILRTSSFLILSGNNLLLVLKNLGNILLLRIGVHREEKTSSKRLAFSMKSDTMLLVLKGP